MAKQENRLWRFLWMEDVLEVYARPYNSSRPVVCVDEVSKELHSTPHGQIAIEPGVPACVDYE